MKLVFARLFQPAETARLEREPIDEHTGRLRTYAVGERVIERLSMHVCDACPARDVAVCRPHPDVDPVSPWLNRTDVQDVPRRRLVIREGDSVSTVGMVSDGWAVCYHVLADGRRQNLAFLLPGDPVLLESVTENRAPYSVETVTPARICFFQKSELLDRLLRNPQRFREYLSVHAGRHRCCYARVTALGRGTGRERVAALILHLYERLRAKGMQAGNALPGPLAQRDIADTVGLTTVYVNRILKAFRAEGMLAPDGDTETVPDIQGIRAIVNAAGLTTH